MLCYILAIKFTNDTFAEINIRICKVASWKGVVVAK